MPGPGADQHIYVSVEAVEQMAQIIDWSPPAAVAALQELCGLQVQRIAQLEEQLAEANQVADAFDVVKRRKARTKARAGGPSAPRHHGVILGQRRGVHHPGGDDRHPRLVRLLGQRCR
jgi:hypothetical protein